MNRARVAAVTLWNRSQAILWRVAGREVLQTRRVVACSRKMLLKALPARSILYLYVSTQTLLLMTFQQLICLTCLQFQHAPGTHNKTSVVMAFCSRSASLR